MKRILVMMMVFMFTNIFNGNAQCEYTITGQSGNNVSFQHIWAVVGIMTIDSVYFDYGDATSQTFYAAPPPGGIPGTSNHTYPGPGTYVTCLTRYMSSLGNPGVPIICTYCDTIVIPPPAGSCFVTSDWDITSITGNTVNFVNLSSCATCTSLFTSWDFGDGTPLSSTYQGPHTYATTGIYNVCLYMTGTNANGVTCTDTFCDVISIGAQPCNITPNYTISVAGNVATFTNLSVCPTCITMDYDWDFGDGTPISNNVSPVHAYTAAGTYYPCLDVYGLDSLGNFCQSTLCDTVIISVSGCFATANFGSSGSGLSKSFLNASSCAGCTGTSTFVWDFGDGSPTSTLVNPIHAYATGGTYNVCLIMTGTFGTGTCVDTFCSSVVVTNPGCTASANFTSTSSGFNASFTNTSTCTNCNTSTYIWDFGDGSPTSSVFSPTHTYPMGGVYNVCLIRNGVSPTGLTCSDTTCNPITIINPGTCAANAFFSNTSNQLVTTFIDLSTCNSCVSTTYSWDFGDGSPLDNTMSPIHTYPFSGTYTTCLIVTGISSLGNVCKDTFCSPVTVQVPIGCAADALFTSSANGNTVNFLNTSTCTTCTSTTYLWKFGDGNTSTWNSPTHTYTNDGTYTVCLYVTGLASNQTICKDSICKSITVKKSLGLNDVVKKELIISPNPTRNFLNIEIPAFETFNELQICDVTGRKLKSISMKNFHGPKYQLDLSDLSAGLYMIQLISTESKYKAQVIKQ